MSLDQGIKKRIVCALETLLLADHLGDAHEAGLVLAKLAFGKKGEDAYTAYVEGDQQAFKGMSEFEILSDDEEAEADE